MILLAALTQPASAQDLLGHWSFEPGHETEDSTGNWDTLVLFGTSSVSGGTLDLNGSGTTSTGHAIAQGYVGPTITDKTLVSWLTLDSTNANAGSGIGIDRIDSDVFDSMVYAEDAAFTWQTGSNNGVHNGASHFDNNLTDLRQIAISYSANAIGGVDIVTCLDGVQQASFARPAVSSWFAGDAEIMMGLRHTFTGGSPGALDATIEDSRVYGVALTCDDVARIVPTTCDAAGELDICQLVGDAAAGLNEQAGALVVHDGAPARLRTSTFRGHVTVLKAALQGGGCTGVGEPNTYDRLSYGEYDTALAGNLGANTNALVGTIDRRARTATMTADDGTVIGGNTGTVRNNRAVGDVDGDPRRVFAAQYVRTAGNRGVWIGMEASCDTDPWEALAGWYGASIPSW